METGFEARLARGERATEHPNGRSIGARKLWPRSPLKNLNQDQNPESRHGYFNGFDGTRLFYSVEGEGAPLVFCYGLVCSSLHWTYQIEHFKQAYQTIWFDYRGHHRSEMPKDRATLCLDSMARDLMCLFDELDLKRAVVFGHSMGVNVALEFYRKWPERVAGLVLANGTSTRPLETMFKHNMMQPLFRALTVAHEKAPAVVRRVMRSLAGNGLLRTLIAMGGFNPHLTPKEDIELYLRQVFDMDPAILVSLINSYEVYDATPWLHEVKTPTLLLGGELDRVIPLEQQEKMAQLIPGSVLEVIRHGSHCAQMDLPDLFSLKVEAFLKKIGYSTT